MTRRRTRTGLAILVLLLALLPLVQGRTEAQTQRALLYEGMRGEDVRWVQERLRWWGYYKGPVDGIFGRRTTAAVLYFQRKNGLRVDGVVGPETWAALGRPLPQRAAGAVASRQGVREADLDLLARLVTAEARGEPYEGQVAVAAVALNRVRDPRFPNTLQEVIYQPLAFESVANGEVYRPATATARKAARDALNGWDPTRGALFFWNPAKAVSQWVWSRTIVKQIGNHVFAK